MFSDEFIRNSVNLPATQFHMKANLNKLEPETQKFWEENRIYDEILERRRGRPWWILHDGPPYANGDAHVGTGLNKVLKDIVCRFKTMRGYYSPFIPGWDCHGLPIELKALNETSMEAAEDSMVLRQKCREFALKYLDIQRRQFKRLGVFAQWDHPYLTMDPEYEYNVLMAFARLVERGFVVRELKPIHWCFTDKTALAEAEIEYKDKTSDSIYVRFKVTQCAARSLAGYSDLDLVIWTTTPWTLPANVAVAAHPAAVYCVVEYELEGKSRAGVVMKDLLKQLESVLNIRGVKGEVAGRELEGTIYEHPLFKKNGRVVLADYVSNVDGTGLVHTAPGHGADDFKSAVKYSLDVISPVDDEGIFTSEAGIFAGQHVLKANEAVISQLRQGSLLISRGKITHSYPHCWRCKNPVIFRATKQWFVLVDKDDCRQRLLNSVEKDISWYPEWGKARIYGMIKERPNWCISRQRKWGIPIPAFLCKHCDAEHLDASLVVKFADMVREKGSDIWFMLDTGEFMKGRKCSKCGSSDFVKEESTFDVWFDSSCSHLGANFRDPQVKPPFELYLEGTDQHRGWFQVSLITSLMAYDKTPYKHCVTHGFLVEPETREKISKSSSKPEYTMPCSSFADKYGADVFRLWLSSINYTNNIPFSSKILEEKQAYYRKVRNTFRFMLGNISDLRSGDHVGYEKLRGIDLWVLDQLSITLDEVTSGFESFEFYKATQKLYNFCDVILSSTYFHIVKDVLYTNRKDSHERRACQSTLAKILDVLVKCFAPIMPHTCEEVWQQFSLRSDMKSVHLTDWPANDLPKLDEAERKDWSILFNVRDEMNRLIDIERKSGALGNSLEAECDVYSENEKVAGVLDRYRAELAAVFVASKVNLCSDKSGLKETQLAGTYIGLRKSPYAKCVRCWKHLESVGKFRDCPQVCSGCYSVLSSLK